MNTNSDSGRKTDFDRKAVKAVHGLLAGIRGAGARDLPVREEAARRYPIAGLIRLDFGGRARALFVAAQPSGEPRHVRQAAWMLESAQAKIAPGPESGMRARPLGVLVAPHLSVAAREILREHGIGYVDFYGNAWLAFDSVVVERSVEEAPKSKPRRLQSLFGRKAAAVLRAMLKDPEKAWRIEALAGEAGVSVGHVSNVRRALIDHEWAEVRADGLALTQPGRLLDAWKGQHRRPPGDEVRGYTVLHGATLAEKLKGLLNAGENKPRLMYAGESAAEWIAPYLRYPTLKLYGDGEGVAAAQRALDLSQGGPGANVVMRRIGDETLFRDAIEPAPGRVCTDEVTTWLDLNLGSERSREAAGFLAAACFAWANPRFARLESEQPRANSLEAGL